MCPHTTEEARRIWSKACNYHRKSDLGHNCSNPSACERRLQEALMVETQWTTLQWEMA
jgi:hypothetical protein